MWRVDLKARGERQARARLRAVGRLIPTQYKVVDEERRLASFHRRKQINERGDLAMALDHKPMVGSNRYAYGLNNPIALKDPSGNINWGSRNDTDGDGDHDIDDRHPGIPDRDVHDVLLGPRLIGEGGGAPRFGASGIGSFFSRIFAGKGSRAGNLSVNSLSNVPSGLANPSTVRTVVADHVKRGSKPFSVATASVQSGGQTSYFVSVSGGNRWKNGAPSELTIDGKTYTVVKTDSQSVASVQLKSGVTNLNHAEQKLFSYIQDSFSGQRVTVNVAVQNTSRDFPGMCSGCNTSSKSFAAANPNFNVNIFHGTSGVNP